MKKSKFDTFDLICLGLLALLWLTNNIQPSPGPGPQPTPDRYIDANGFNLLVIYDEQNDRHKLDPDQADLLDELHGSTDFRKWLDEHLDKWEEISPTDPVESLDEIWKPVIGRRPDNEPLWFVATGPKGSWEGAPHSSQAVLEALQSLEE